MLNRPLNLRIDLFNRLTVQSEANRAVELERLSAEKRRASLEKKRKEEGRKKKANSGDVEDGRGQQPRDEPTSWRRRGSGASLWVVYLRAEGSELVVYLNDIQKPGTWIRLVSTDKFHGVGGSQSVTWEFEKGTTKGIETRASGEDYLDREDGTTWRRNLLDRVTSASISADAGPVVPKENYRVTSVYGYGAVTGDRGYISIEGGERLSGGTSLVEEIVKLPGFDEYWDYGVYSRGDYGNGFWFRWFLGVDWWGNQHWSAGYEWSGWYGDWSEKGDSDTFYISSNNYDWLSKRRGENANYSRALDGTVIGHVEYREVPSHEMWSNGVWNTVEPLSSRNVSIPIYLPVGMWTRDERYWARYSYVPRASGPTYTTGGSVKPWYVGGGDMVCWRSIAWEVIAGGILTSGDKGFIKVGMNLYYRNSGVSRSQEGRNIHNVPIVCFQKEPNNPEPQEVDQRDLLESESESYYELKIHSTIQSDSVYGGYKLYRNDFTANEFAIAGQKALIRFKRMDETDPYIAGKIEALMDEVDAEGFHRREIDVGHPDWDWSSGEFTIISVVYM